MTTRRRVLLFGLIAVALALVASVWVLWPRRPSEITWANHERLRIGMTLKEVEEVLGGPARDETTCRTANANDGSHFYWYRERKDWVTDTLVISVGFDADGLVYSFGTWGNQPVPESLPDKFRRWLRL